MSNGENSSLTIEEIVNEYIDDCVNDKHWTPIPTDHAEKQLPNLMLELFGATKSHGVLRNGKAKRGFWKVRFV